MGEQSADLTITFHAQCPQCRWWIKGPDHQAICLSFADHFRDRHPEQYEQAMRFIAAGMN